MPKLREKQSAAYTAVKKEFGSFTHAAKKLGVERNTIYRYIDEPLPKSAIKKIKLLGYDPEIFTSK